MTLPASTGVGTFGLGESSFGEHSSLACRFCERLGVSSERMPERRLIEHLCLYHLEEVNSEVPPPGIQVTGDPRETACWVVQRWREDLLLTIWKNVYRSTRWT